MSVAVAAAAAVAGVAGVADVAVGVADAVAAAVAAVAAGVAADVADALVVVILSDAVSGIVVLTRDVLEVWFDDENSEFVLLLRELGIVEDRAFRVSGSYVLN